MVKPDLVRLGTYEDRLHAAILVNRARSMEGDASIASAPQASCAVPARASDRDQDNIHTTGHADHRRRPGRSPATRRQYEGEATKKPARRGARSFVADGLTSLG